MDKKRAEKKAAKKRKKLFRKCGRLTVAVIAALAVVVLQKEETAER